MAFSLRAITYQTLITFLALMASFTSASPTPTSPSQGFKTIVDTAVTASQACPAETGSARNTGLALLPLDNGDITMCLTSDLARNISAIRSAHCPNGITQQCRDLWHDAIAGGKMHVQSRAVGIGAAMFFLVVSWVVQSVVDRLVKGSNGIPVSLNLPAAEKSGMQEAAAASEGVIFVESGLPPATIAGAPAASAVTGGAALATTTAKAPDGKLEQVLMWEFDDDSLNWFRGQLKDPTCATSQAAQRRDTIPCSQSDLKLAQAAMSQVASGALSKLLNLQGQVPMLKTDNMAYSVKMVFEFGRKIDALALISDNSLYTLATILYLTALFAKGIGKVPKTQNYPWSNFSNDFYKPGSQVAVTISSSSFTSRGRYLVLPSLNADIGMLDKSISSIMEDKDMTYFTYITTTNNFWDVTPKPTQKASIQKLPGVLTIATIKPTTLEEPILDIRSASPNPSTSPIAQDRRRDAAHRSADVASDANEMTHPIQKRNGPKVKVQIFPWNDDKWVDFDIKYYVLPTVKTNFYVTPAGTQGRPMGFVNYVYPDLSSTPVWIYIIETGIWTNHPDLRAAKDAGQFDPDYVTFSHLRASEDLLNAPVRHGTMVASKLVGKIFGTIKNAKIILVNFPLYTKIGSHITWKSIHDDVIKRRRKGEAQRGRVFVFSAQSEFWGDDNTLRMEPLDFDKVRAERDSPGLESVKSAIHSLMFKLDVPIFLAAGNIMEIRTAKHIKEFPMLWGIGRDFPLINIGGVDKSGRQDDIAVVGWPASAGPGGAQITVNGVIEASEAADIEVDSTGTKVVREGSHATRGTSIGGAAAAGAAIDAILLAELSGKDWFDRSEFNQGPGEMLSTGKFVQSVWNFFNNGIGSQSLTTEDGLRVVRNMLDGTKGPNQCAVSKRDLGNSSVCVADNGDSSDKDISTSTLLPTATRTSNSSATQAYVATCITDVNPKVSTASFDRADITPAASIYCSSMLPAIPLATPLHTINNWSYKSELNMGATLQSDTCKGYHDSEQCFAELMSIWQQCPKFGGYLTVPNCVKLEMHPGMYV